MNDTDFDLKLMHHLQSFSKLKNSNKINIHYSVHGIKLPGWPCTNNTILIQWWTTYVDDSPLFMSLSCV